MFKIKFELKFELKKANAANQHKFEKSTQIVDDVPALIKKFATHRGDQCEVYNDGQHWLTVTKLSNEPQDYRIEFSDCEIRAYDYFRISDLISTIARGLEKH